MQLPNAEKRPDASFGKDECRYEEMLVTTSQAGKNFTGAVRLQLYVLTRQKPDESLNAFANSIELTPLQRMAVRQCANCIFNSDCVAGYVYDRPAPRIPMGRVRKPEPEVSMPHIS